ncbi:MAG: glycosyltransferase [Lachnospiraceae bacterium]|nr:glycosyltransferase [Lachnospiraceae bacterium]
MDLISVVITTYNRPLEILKRAVLSAYNQSYQPIEIIVVNDCPQNAELAKGIKNMLLEIDKDIIYIVHPENMGACAARNSGLNVAKGEFIGFLDDDDEWLEDKLSKQIALMKDDVGLVGCDSIRISGEHKKHYHPSIPKGDQISAILKTNFLGSTSFPLLRTKWVKEAGGFDVNAVSCQDYDLWIRILLKHKYEFANEALVNCYDSQDSTFKNSKSKFFEGCKYLIKKYEDVYSNYQDALLYKINNDAVSVLIFNKDVKTYLKFKKLAFSIKVFDSRNFFTLFIKIFNRLRGKKQ